MAWPPRRKSCRQGSVAEASGDYSQVVQHSSVFVQRYYTGEWKKKKEKKGNSWNAERLTQQQKKSSSGSQCASACTRTMPGPTIEIDDRDHRSQHAKLGRKISLSGFCLFFKPRLPHVQERCARRRSTFGVHAEGSLAQTWTEKDGHRQLRSFNLRLPARPGCA